MGFDSTTFGRVSFDGQVFTSDIIIGVNLSLQSRPMGMGSHNLSEAEIKMLTAGSPKTIIIGTGQYCSLNVDSESMGMLKETGATVIVEATPAAIQTYNKTKGSKSALIHVTC